MGCKFILKLYDVKGILRAWHIIRGAGSPVSLNTPPFRFSLLFRDLEIERETYRNIGGERRRWRDITKREK